MENFGLNAFFCFARKCNNIIYYEKKKTYKCLLFHSPKVAFKYQIVYHSASDHIYVNRNRRKHKEEDLNLQ